MWHTLIPAITISKRISGLKIYFCLRDNINHLFFTKGVAAEIKETLSEPCKMFWDAGSNIGMFSLIAAEQGKDVVAFDISAKALAYLEKSAHVNNLHLKTCQSAFTVDKINYQKVSSSYAENRVVQDVAQFGSDIEESITYLEAAEKYGVPDMIKMDIEGCELDFFKSRQFKEWTVHNEITLAVEIHSDQIRESLWKDVRHRWLDSNHIIYNSKVG